MLTKSLFNLAVECPTKVYYKHNGYESNNNDDEFLKALAQGGFQVGELARCYYPDGILIEEQNLSQAFARTQELLQRESVTIFEATFIYQGLLARVDILVKEGNNIQVIESKSKSVNNDETGLNKNGSISADWMKYFYDVAFQTYLVKKVLTEDYTIKSYLFLADKESKATVQDLHTKFRVRLSDSGYFVERTGDCSVGALGEKILRLLEVTSTLETIHNLQEDKNLLGLSFDSFIAKVKSSIQNNEKINCLVGKKCKNCEFASDQVSSGFDECWDPIFELHPDESKNSIIYNIWDYRLTDKRFDEGMYFMSKLNADEFTPVNSVKSLERKERQWLQVQSVLNGTTSEYINTDGLMNAFDSWKYPLHLIDFETSRVSIPFKLNKRPYQLIAFQFSHHTIDANWNIEHKGQFLSASPDSYPNFEFLRELKSQLEGDNGSIFMYHHYERDVLNSLYKEVSESIELENSEKIELMNWISELTTGQRAIVDLLKLLRHNYYHPKMRGSNSLKIVLPTILNASEFLKNKYSQPIYGTDLIRSLNFQNKKWIEFDNELVKDPYDQLEKFDFLQSGEDEERFFSSTGIHNGGAAMMAYNQMQFIEMSDGEKDRLEKALYQYCELDTFAMVMLLEYWKSLLARPESLH